jgi:phosphoribosyl 1,2-cyclic phosphodiesterase
VNTFNAPFQLTVLGSGSSGNCALVETAGTRVLVDAGLSARRMANALGAIGVQPHQIDAILITHEHSDHAAGVAVWSKRHQTPVYANRLTAEALSRGTEGTAWRIFSTGADFTIGDLNVQSFAIPHDAAEPVGFVLRHAKAALGFLTDLGFATRMVTERVREVHTLVIETNHDERMLQNDTRRPWSVKQRIMSRHGHLSNAAAAEVLAEIAGNGLQRAVLGHLSEDCNTPELAVSTVRNRLALSGAESVQVLCATAPEARQRMVIHQGR